MEIIKLTETDVPYAVNLANITFDFCVRRPSFAPNNVMNNMPDNRIIKFYEEYVNIPTLQRQVLENTLHMWGIKNGEYLVAMGAMNNFGHITMLYVHPNYMRRGLGKTLLKTMKGFALSALRIDRLTVNVMPVYAKDFFTRNGFLVATNYIAPNMCYIPMTAKCTPEFGYEKKSVPTKVILWTSIGGLALITLITVAYTLYYLIV